MSEPKSLRVRLGPFSHAKIKKCRNEWVSVYSACKEEYKNVCRQNCKRSIFQRFIFDRRRQFFRNDFEKSIVEEFSSNWAISIRIWYRSFWSFCGRSGILSEILHRRNSWYKYSDDILAFPSKHHLLGHHEPEYLDHKLVQLVTLRIQYTYIKQATVNDLK